MPRARKGAARRQSKVRWFKLAKGNRGGRRNQWRRAKHAVIRGGVYAYKDRRLVKREYRSLWIIRLNAAAQAAGLRYSQFIAGLKAANIALNRKMLSEIAISDPKAFEQIMSMVKAALPKTAKTKAA